MNNNKIESIITDLGYETVRIMMMRAFSRPTMQIMIDTLDGRAINVEDCAKVSRALTKVFEEDEMPELEYTLEISSTGIDRPLTKPHHFKRFVGHEARVETTDSVQERKRFKGPILSADDKEVIIETDGVPYTIPHSSINKAKLVLTDELLKALTPTQEEEE